MGMREREAGNRREMGRWKGREEGRMEKEGWKGEDGKEGRRGEDGDGKGGGKSLLTFWGPLLMH